MDHQRQNFYRALTLLNSLLVPVFALSLVEIFNFSFLIRFGFIFVILITLALKVYCMSGLAGCILEIISTEEIVIRIRRIHQNVMGLFPSFLVVFVIIRLIDFILFALFHSSFLFWRPLYFDLTTALAALVLARWTINKKYIRPMGIPDHPLKLDRSFLLVLVSACALEFALVSVSGFIHLGDLQWQRVSIFMLNYIHVFEFIFCSLYIFDGFPQVHEKFNSSPEVFLVNPMGAGIIKSLLYSFMRGHPPFFVVLKALTPKTYKFREFDQVLWHERYYKSNVLVCITCFTSNSYEAYKIAKEFKKRGSKVIMGGPHVTYLPNEALACCDSVVVGQAEGVWKQVLHDFENGTLRPQYRGPANEADYSKVQEELLNSPPYIIKDFLETTRGCKFRCHFCTIPALSGGQVRLAAINDIVDLIKKVKPHSRKITFIDNNIYSDPGYAKELFTALKPLKIEWQGMCTIDIAKNKETLKLARESGCSLLLFGYEIFGDSLEKKQGGKFGMAQKYIEYTKIIKESGIKISGLFIFGFDSDNLSSFFRLWRFCLSIIPQIIGVSMLTPLPGSGVYRDMLTQNRIINQNWRSYDYGRLVVRHPQMNPVVVSFFLPIIEIFLFLTASFLGRIVLGACLICFGILFIVYLKLGRLIF